MDYLEEQILLETEFPMRFFRTNGFQEMPHRHKCLELNYIESGNGYYVIENKTYPMCKGDIFLINNEELHMAVNEEQISMKVLVFDTALVWGSGEKEAFLKPFFKRNDHFSNRIEAGERCAAEITEYMSRIEIEQEQRGTNWQLVIKAVLLLILAVMNRHYESEHALRENASVVGRSYERIREVVEYIGTHYQNHISLGELADVASMSSSYLSTYFKETMNITIVDYIEKVRIHQACILLRTTDKQVVEIALACGYNNISYFNRAFRKVIKETPSEYRKREESDI